MVIDMQNIDKHYDDSLKDVYAHILDNLDDKIDRQILADIAGYSVPHFHRIFVSSTGKSPADYVRCLRLKRAGQKLRMGAVDITEVALAAGYCSHTSFSKEFKKHFGISPSDFRNLECHIATQLLRKGKD